MKTLGERIQQLRKEKRLTQAGLASNVGVSLAQLTRYETQGVQPGADTLRRMAMVFGITIDFLVNGTTEQKAEGALVDSKLLSLFKAVERMPKDDKAVILTLIDAFIVKQQIKDIVK
jgi:transcriptional regulator with XRE-family HTH domain